MLTPPRQFGTLTEKVTDYEKLLKDLLPRVNEADAKLIRASLEKVCKFLVWLSSSTSLTQLPQDPNYEAEESATELTAEASSSRAIDVDGEEESGAESEASAGAGSTGALDRTDEDFTRDQVRHTGFMGKNSEVTWLQRLRQQNRHGDDNYQGNETQKRPNNALAASLTSKRPVNDEQPIMSEGEPGVSIQDSSYHMDDMSIFTYDVVDAYELPTPEIATHLFNVYMQRVHSTFPVVGRLNLTSQFQRFISGTVQRPPEKWLAILNLIFAIGAKYSHLINAEWKGDERDHLIYFTRARLLSMNSETIFHHPDLQMIQIIGLMSFYLLCIGQMNR